AIALAPEYAWSHYELGTVLLLQNDLAGAIDAFKKASALAPNSAEPHFFLAMAHWQSGDKDEARKRYEHAVQWFHTNCPSNAELGRLCTETEGLLGIFAAYQQAVLDTPRSAEAHNRLGRFLLRSKGDTAAALPHLREATRLDPKLIEAHFNLGCALQGKPNWCRAEESFQKVVQLQPTYRNARDAVTYSLNMAVWGLVTNPDPAKRNPKRAVELARRAVELEPENDGSWYILGVACYRAGEWTEALN